MRRFAALSVLAACAVEPVRHIPDLDAQADEDPRAVDTFDASERVGTAGTAAADTATLPAAGWQLHLRDPVLDVAAMAQANLAVPDTYAGDTARLQAGTHRLVSVVFENTGTDPHLGYPGVALSASDPAVATSGPFLLYGLLPGEPYTATLDVTVGEAVGTADVTLTLSATALGCDRAPPVDCPAPAAVQLVVPTQAE